MSAMIASVQNLWTPLTVRNKSVLWFANARSYEPKTTVGCEAKIAEIIPVSIRVPIKRYKL